MRYKNSNSLTKTRRNASTATPKHSGTIVRHNKIGRILFYFEKQ